MLVPVTISVSHRTANLPPSFAILSMATVIQYPDLMEEICNLLSTSLRRDMIALALEQKMVNSAIPLLYTWTEPVLSLKSIFPTINCNPELGGGDQESDFYSSQEPQCCEMSGPVRVPCAQDNIRRIIPS